MPAANRNIQQVPDTIMAYAMQFYKVREHGPDMGAAIVANCVNEMSRKENNNQDVDGLLIRTALAFARAAQWHDKNQLPQPNIWQTQLVDYCDYERKAFDIARKNLRALVAI